MNPIFVRDRSGSACRIRQAVAMEEGTSSTSEMAKTTCHSE
jgi:hypothetical protein